MEKVSVQKHWRATLERIEKFISDTYFTDANLRGRLYSDHTPLSNLRWHDAGQGKISFSEAEAALGKKDSVSSIGDVSIGPTWTTHWFRCETDVPAGWAGLEVRLRWDSGGEAMVWVEGEPQQGLTGSYTNHQLRTDFTLTKQAKGGEKFVVYIEAVASDMFGAGARGMINPPDPSRYYPLSLAEVAVFDRGVYDLLLDLTIIYDMAKNLPEGSERAYQALYTANDMVNACNPFDRTTFPRCRAMAAHFLTQRNGQSQHTIHAMGHCHIDSAWLWPYSESIRKCARSWSATLRLMEDYPSFTFVCSQAQQLEWVKTHYPGLYDRIVAKARAGQFIPVGGTWIEMDGNIPSGESFVRQFLVGQNFFKAEFGHYCKEFWLPDTFGYSAQLPQIMAGAGIRYFMSQKLSWNLTNKFPHNTFLWEGIDGTSCLAHFPPADTYGSCADVKDVLKTASQSREKGRSRHSMLLYGHGDGGGGPTENMLEFLNRMEDVDGLPKVVLSSPQQFFEAIDGPESHKFCKWVGELYLELHRGTYTTQAKLKMENRKGEFLLHDLDFLCAVGLILSKDLPGAVPLKAQLVSLWKKFLLNQFHDVLPGSCIQKVVEDALAYYKDVKEKATLLLKSQLDAVINKVWQYEAQAQSLPVVCLAVINTSGWQRCEVVPLPREGERGEVVGVKKKPTPHLTQAMHDGTEIGLVKCVPFGLQIAECSLPQAPLSVSESLDGTVTLENGFLKATIKSGVLTSLVHKETGREAIAENCAGNQFVLFDDVPLYWDAWDVMEYHLETRKPLPVLSKSVIVQNRGPLRASVQVRTVISGQSSIIQQVILDAKCPYLRFETTVEWHESHKFLKVEFPLNVHSHEATYEIQFGHLRRPTHFNTSWDQARFEVCAQKWADLSEHGFGVAVLNDGKYGYSTLGNIMRLSLLRSPKAPNDDADMGPHNFSYAIMPHKGTFQEAGVIQQSYNLNHPMIVVPSPFSGKTMTLFEVDSPAIVLETVKMAEASDTSAIVIRLYEAFGGQAITTLKTVLPIKTTQRCNVLEEPIGPIENWTGEMKIKFEPFKLINILLHF